MFCSSVLASWRLLFPPELFKRSDLTFDNTQVASERLKHMSALSLLQLTEEVTILWALYLVFILSHPTDSFVTFY